MTGLAALAILGLVISCIGLGFVWGRQRARDELRASREQFVAALAQQEAAWWESDAEGRVQRWFGGGSTPAIAAGQRIADHFQPDAADPGAASHLHAALQAPAVMPPCLARTRDGGGPWLLSAQPLHDAAGAFRGHLGRAAPFEALGSALSDEAMLGLLWPALPLPAFEARREHPQAPWRLHRSTPAGARMLGLDPSTALPAEWPEALARLPQPLREAAASLQPGEHTLQGEWRLSLLATPLPSTTTEAEARLLLLQPAVAARSAAEVADQESFMFSVSHDLRAPIRVVDGFARILKEDHGRQLDRIGNDHLDRILGAAARMNSMIDAMLALSRLQTQPLQRQNVDLSLLAGYILDDLRRHDESRVVQAVVEPGMVVQGDPTLLRVALENLLGNAWKYSTRVSPAIIEFSRVQQDGRTLYLVADNGAGFDMRFADRLFGVFQRLHSANDFPGTGVGLASTRRILRRHGGDIWAEGEVGRGARFYFTL